jgi:filamentous hemagglutinin family protein
MKKIMLIIVIMLICPSNVLSEAIFDGTIHPNTKGMTLQGNFEVKAEQGKISGNNLYHSFERFNINENETATFTGPEHIDNVISRVSGMEQSIINGTLLSEIPDANFYLLNPAGVFFGENAMLDIKGAFHASTADYLVMRNNDIVNCQESDILFSIAAPEAFGFFDDSSGSIEISNNGFLEGNTGQSLSFIGGDILIKESYVFVSEGRINIASSQSSGEIRLIESGFEIKDNLQRGSINISDFSILDVSGGGSGDIFIWGGNFFLKDSSLWAYTEGLDNGGITSIDINMMDVSENAEIRSEFSMLPEMPDLKGGDIFINAIESVNLFNGSGIVSSTDGGNAGYIHIKAKNVTVNMSNIESRTMNIGNAGNISIEAIEDIRFSDDSTILSDTIGAGNAGNIDLKAQNILLLNASGLGNQTSSSGNGGKISIHADQSFQLIGTNGLGYASDLTTFSNGTGNAGQVVIDSPMILIKDGGRIYSSAENKGDGGKIILNSTDGIIELQGVNPHGENVDGFNSCISSQSEQTGKAGDIYLTSRHLNIQEGAYISNNSSGDGESGIIHIKSSSLQINGKASVINHDYYLQSQLDFENNQMESKKKELSGIYSRAEYQDFSDKSGGKIDISSENLTLFDNGTITTSSTGKRDAGDIDIKTNRLKMDTMSSIASESLAKEYGGAAGRINVQSNDSIVIQNNSALTTEAVNTISTDKSLDNGKIEIETKNRLLLANGKITTSVQGGSGHGGDIEIAAKDVAMNHSIIKANAYEGDGGNIHIVSEVFIQSQDSIVEASSEKGIDGIIEIESPDTDPSSGLVSLSSNFLDASQWMKSSCDKRSSENISRLIVRGKDAAPAKPDDLHSSPAIVFKDLHLKQPDIKHEIAKAETCYQKGDFESAAKIWFDAEKKLKKHTKNYLTTVTYLIQALQSIGFHHKALALSKKVLPVAEKSKKSPERILFYNSYGDLLLSLNELPDAIKYLKIALNDAKESKNKAIMASVMNHIANAVIVDGDINTGIQIYDNALIFLSKSDKTALKAKIYLNLAYVISMIGTYEESITAFNDALAVIQSLPDNHDKAFDLNSLSKIGLLIDKFFPKKSTQSKTSYRLLASAQVIGEKNNDLKMISMSSGNAANILEKSGQYEKALKKIRYAIFIAEQANNAEIAYKWHWQAGRLFKKMGNESQAIVSYKKAISLLSSIREELFSGIRLKMDIFQVDIKPVYLGLAEIYLDQADRESHPQKKEQKVLLAREVMESLKNAELADYFEDECVGGKQKNQSNALTRTPEGVALLYPIALPDRLTILITLPDALKHYNVDIAYSELNKMVRSYRKYIQVRSSNQFLGVSQKLYQLLIRPVENDLLAANIHTLLVAPDGVLRLVPFSSLHDNKSFLIEKYAIVTIPAVNMTDTNPSTYSKENMKTLVVGLSDAVQDFSALPSINEELRDIKKIMNGKKMYKNTDYTIANVQNEFKTNDYNIVHFATHGVFGGTGKNSFLLTYESQLDMNKLEDLMSLGKYRNHQVDMLTLSACQTALGNERAALGLAGVAVKAGVKSAVATLWYVDDQATSLAIRELYRQLKKDNMTKAKALQNAQKKLLSMHRYWHPIYWAPFLLIGSWI